ncbi:MAG TPA: hypothetical protein VLC30_04920 [Pseudomonas sp.]|nr:hypothetical protein [Pseudomonas sp.]
MPVPALDISMGVRMLQAGRINLLTENERAKSYHPHHAIPELIG